MEVSDLRTFIRHETGSISHAAKAFAPGASGVTARIMLMEEELGIQLFLREKALAAHSKGTDALHLCPPDNRVDG